MADSVLKIFLQLQNPDLLTQLEKLNNSNFTLNIRGNIDKGVKDILSIGDKFITLNVNSGQALGELRKVEQSLRDLQNLSKINIGIGGSPDVTINNTLRAQLQELKNLGFGTPGFNARATGRQGLETELDTARLGKALQGFEADLNLARQQQKIFEQSPQFLEDQAVQALQSHNAALALEKSLSQELEQQAIQAFNSHKSALALEKANSDQLEQEAIQAFNSHKSALALEKSLNQEAEQQAIQAFNSNKSAVALQQSLVSDAEKEAIKARELQLLNQNAPIRLKQAELQEFQKTQALQKANESFGSNLFISKEQAALSAGVLPSEITAQKSFFSPGNLKNPETASTVLLSGLLGGPVAALGGLAGAATIGGPIGALVGTTIFEAIADQFKQVAGALEQAAQAGLQLQKAITSITAIFQSTTKVLDLQGNALPLNEQLAIQSQRARETQQATRQQLAPLGFGIEGSTTILQSILLGASERGLNFNPEQLGTLSKRFASAIVALEPESVTEPARILKTLPDIVGGLPRAQSSEIGAALRSVVPQLFTQGGIKSEAEFLRATQALEQFYNTLTNLPDIAAIPLAKLSATFQNAQANFGDILLQKIVPGLNALADALADPQVQNGLNILASAIGDFANRLLEIGASVTKFVLNPDTLKGAGSIFDIVFNALKNASGPLGKFIPNSDVVGALRIKENEQLVKGLIDTASGALGKDFKIETNPAKIVTQALNSAFGKSDLSEFIPKISNLTPGAQRDELNRALAAQALQGFTPEQSLGTQFALNEVTKAEIARNQSLQDTTTSLGKIASAEASLTGSVDLIANSKAAFTIASENLANVEKGTDAYSKALAGVESAENSLIASRKQSFEATNQLISAERSQTAALKAAIDTTTNAGKLQAIEVDRQGILKERTTLTQNLNDLQKGLAEAISPLEKTVLQQEINQRQLDIGANKAQEAQNIRQNENQQVAGFDIFRETTRAIEDFPNKIKELQVSFVSLTDAVTSAARSLQQFSDSAQLRELGRTGQLVELGQNIVSAGGDLSELPPEIRQLVENPEKLQEFKLKQAREQFRVATIPGGNLNRFTFDDIQAEQQRALEGQKTTADIALKRFPFQVEDTISAFNKELLKGAQEFPKTFGSSADIVKKLTPEAIKEAAKFIIPGGSSVTGGFEDNPIGKAISSITNKSGLVGAIAAAGQTFGAVNETSNTGGGTEGLPEVTALPEYLTLSKATTLQTFKGEAPSLVSTLLEAGQKLGAGAEGTTKQVVAATGYESALKTLGGSDLAKQFLAPGGIIDINAVNNANSLNAKGASSIASAGDIFKDSVSSFGEASQQTAQALKQNKPADLKTGLSDISTKLTDGAKSQDIYNLSDAIDSSFQKLKDSASNQDTQLLVQALQNIAQLTESVRGNTDPSIQKSAHLSALNEAFA